MHQKLTLYRTFNARDYEYDILFQHAEIIQKGLMKVMTIWAVEGFAVHALSWTISQRHVIAG